MPAARTATEEIHIDIHTYIHTDTDRHTERKQIRRIQIKKMKSTERKITVRFVASAASANTAVSITDIGAGAVERNKCINTLAAPLERKSATHRSVTIGTEK